MKKSLKQQIDIKIEFVKETSNSTWIIIENKNKQKWRT